MAASAKRRARQDDAVLKRKVLDASTLLAPSDRRLVQQYFWRDLKLPEVAALRRTSARTVQRQIDRICRLVANPSFNLFLKYQGSLPVELRNLGREHFLQGHSLRTLAAKRGRSLYQTHKMITQIRVALLLAQAAPRRAEMPPPDHETLDVASEES